MYYTKTFYCLYINKRIPSLRIRVSRLWKWCHCNLWCHRALSWNNLEH